MQKNNIKTFAVSENIDYSQIKIFVDFYKDCLEGKKINNEFELIIEIKNTHNINSDTINSIKGNVDFIFISYLILFIDEFKNTKVYFKFIDVENIDRAFSLRLQLEQLKQITGFSNIFLEGEYVTKDGEIKNIYLSQNNEISQSQKFIPPIFIKDKLSVDYYFKISDPEKNLLVKYYYENIKKKTNGKFKIEALSYIEYYLINLLIIGKKNINENDFLTFKSIANKIALGLKELATNINHSSKQKGVITARIYDKKTILSLKSKIENEYLYTRNEDLYLDINVIDFGEISIRQKYIENIKENFIGFEEILNKKDYENDSKLIQNDYLYKDFFIVDIEKLEKTYHQKNKLISRYGLQYFTHIITENFNGFVKTSSQKEGVAFYKKDKKTSDSIKREVIENTNCDFVEQGTFYNSILPINFAKSNNEISDKTENIDSKNAANINCFYKLEKYNVISGNNDTIDDYSLIKVELNNESSHSKPYQNIISIYNQFQKTELNKRNNIFIIDALETNIENESEWLRLLTVLTLDFKNIIIYNIDYQITEKLFNLRKVESKIKEYDFWNEESCVLFYSFKKRNNDRRFGANVLYGKDETFFNQINKKIYSHHYSFEFFENRFVTKDININSKLFKGNELLYFELIIFNKDQYNSKFTLFEESIQYSLNTPLNVNKETKNNSGYKIEDTHFRLGSKIHISDFYYAKRMFQNSFFTTPFAFLLAKEIFDKKSVIKSSNILLYGYESYSDFLLSTTRKLLGKMFPKTYKIIHSTLVSDKLTREIDFKGEKFSIITIVPIASSFSTSVKMRNLFQNFMKNEKIEFIEPFYNLVLVADNNFEEKIDENGIFTYNKLKSFNWYSLKLASKEINIKTHIVEGDSIKQKYFVPVYTNWHKAENCDDCYPKKSIQQEKCLFETGKESITPQLIFDYPIVKESISFNYLSFKDAIIYGNLKKYDNKYLYYIRTARLLRNRDNDENVVKWLKHEIKPIINKNIINKKVVIVTPSLGSKSNFLDLVNEVLFNYSANCLTISIREDYLNNSKTLYKDGLHKAECVIYVDDVLSTAQAFFETNNIVSHIREKNINGNGIDYCISLINRMPSYKEEELLYNLSQENFVDLNSKNIPPYLYFTKVFAPTIEEANKQFPLDKEVERYNKLIETSSLDPIRKIFIDKAEKLKEKDISKPLNKRDKNSQEFNERKVFQFLVVNAIFKIFEKEGELDFLEIKDYSKPIDSNFEYFKNLIKTDLWQDKLHKELINKNIYNLEYVILKVLCTVPLVYYKDLRMFTFSYILFKIKFSLNKIEKLKTNEDYLNFFSVSNENKYSEFQNFKFLLKRAVQLKSNIIIHKEFFEKLKLFINSLNSKNNKLYEFAKKRNELFLSKLNILKEKYPNKIKELNSLLDNLSLNRFEETNSIPIEIEFSKEEEFNKDFELLKDLKYYKVTPTKQILYQYTALVQELILEHEIKAVKLESTINDFKLESTNSNGDFNHYLRLLRLENTAAIDLFWKYYKSVADFNNSDILTCIKKFKTDPKFDSIRELIDIQKHITADEIDSITEDHYFINFLKLKTEFKKWYNPIKRYSIKEQINTILQHTSKIIGINNNNNKGGAFFTLKYGSNIEEKFVFEKYLSYSADSNNKNIDISSIDTSDSMTFDFFEDVKIDEEYILSNLEIRNLDGELKVREGIKLNNALIDFQEKVEFKYCSLFNRKNFNILIVKITKLDEKENKLVTQGVLTYFMEIGERIDEKKLRLLLLLRKTISKFIDQQFDNNGIRAYIEQEKTKHIYGDTSHLFNKLSEYKENTLVKEEIILLQELMIYKLNLQKLDFDQNDESDLIELLLNNQIYVCQIDKKSIEEKIKIIFNIIFRNLNSDSLEILLNYKNLEYYELIILEIIFEAFYNAEKYSLPKFSIKEKIKIIVELNDNYLFIKNNAVDTINVNTDKINLDKEYSKNNGLNLIHRLTKIISKNFKSTVYIEKIDNDNYFVLKVPININYEENNTY